MNEANGNKLVSGDTLSSGAALVAGQVGKGLYLQHETSHLDLGFYDSRCFYDPDFCTEGVTFAMWIKIGYVPPTRPGFLLDSGSYHFAGKGNL